MLSGDTQKFTLPANDEDRIKVLLSTVAEALVEKNYDPVKQIVGYLLSEDPTYITNHKNARGIIRHIDRYELLILLVKNFLAEE